MSTPKKQGYLVVIQPDGTETRTPFKGREPAYEDLRAAVGGLIASVVLKCEDGRRRNGFVHDEGLLIGLPVNPRASAMYKAAHPGMTAFAGPGWGTLVGPCVIIWWEKVQ